jgi:predicted acetyltransferase
MSSVIFHNVSEMENTLEIRPLTEEHKLESLYVGAQAFGHGERGPSWLDAPNRPDLDGWGLWEEAGLQARMYVLRFQVHLRPEVVVPMGGIAGVACLPASRGKGYAGALMRYSLERMREAGQIVSVLLPFSFDYYRRFGWEWIGVDRRYAVPSRILRPDPETENVRAATPADRPAIQAVYAQFAGRYRGPIARDEKHWNRVLEDSDERFTYTYLYEQEGRPEGYLTCRDGKGEETELREFLTVTARARRALLGLLRRHEMQIQKFVWFAPGDDTLWSQIAHWDIETRSEPKAMGRLVDVPGALQAWKPDADRRGTVIFGVRDECASWNAGTWRAEFEGGRVRVLPSKETPQVSLSIQALSQAYFGTPTVDEIRDADHLTVHDEAGYRAFRALFDGPPMWMNDGF